jgi:hypothetical protein
MAYEVNWQPGSRIMRNGVYGDLTLSELRLYTRDVLAILDQADGPVHIVADISALREYPKSVLSLRGVLMPLLQHPRLGWIVVYGQRNSAISFLLSAVMNMTYVRSRLVTSEKEALDVLQKADATLGG